MLSRIRIVLPFRDKLSHLLPEIRFLFSEFETARIPEPDLFILVTVEFDPARTGVVDAFSRNDPVAENRADQRTLPAAAVTGDQNVRTFAELFRSPEIPFKLGFEIHILHFRSPFVFPVL